MDATVDERRRSWRIAASAWAVLWLASLALPVDRAPGADRIWGWRMLILGWGLTWTMTIAWMANPVGLALAALTAFRREPPGWTPWAALAAAALAATSLLWAEVMGVGAWVWLASYLAWPTGGRAGAPKDPAPSSLGPRSDRPLTP